eukprot:tig00020938_g16160.t1
MCAPKYFTCCLTFGIFEYEAMEEDLDENGEICFNYCRLLRNISLECRKGDCFQHIMLNPAKNEITLQHGHRPQRQRDRPAKLAFEIDATAASRPNEPAADEFLKLLEALDAKFCEFVQQNQAKLKVSPGRSLSKDQISVLQTPSVRIKVDKESGQAFYKYLNMRIRTQTMAGKRKTIPVVDMSNYLITERATIAPATCPMQ